MLFTSTLFLTRFLPVVLALDWAAEALGRWRTRWVVLLLASLVFYADWRADHLPVLLGSVLFNYAVGRRLDAPRPGGRALLAFGVTGNLALLGAFKYAGFLALNAAGLLGGAGLLDPNSVRVPQIALPLGISFFTFTQIAYLVDCAHGRRGGHGPLEYALFVAFFPHLLAGPIIHHSELIPQFRTARRTLDAAVSDAAEGAALFALGAAKKLLLADPLSPAADAAFSAAAGGAALDPGQAWLGALAYTFQLYFDFSGYSDMAVGLARLFGVRFPANFDSPYKATSITAFWRRWHMTLSRWLRDYLYIPLGGNRGGEWGRCRNLMLTMLLGGLWHGAHWNFVIWGGLHGAALVAAHLARHHLGGAGGTAPSAAPLSRLGRGARAALSWAATFLFVTGAWVFFRAPTTEAAFSMLSAMGRAAVAPDPVWPAFAGTTGALLGLAAAVAFLAPNSIAVERALASRRPIGLAAAAVAGAAAAAAVLSALSGPAASPFLYFNF